MTRMRNGEVVQDSRLGRLPSYDERSRAFQIRPVLEAIKAEGKPTRRRPRPGPTLNQSGPPCTGAGGDSGCVGFSFCHILNAGPVRRSPQWKHDEACGAYRRGQNEDEWEGNDAGTSLLAVARAAHHDGYIDGYRWIGAGSQTPIDDTRETLDLIGPVWFGIPWYTSMFNPSPGGWLEVDPGSGLAGYHAIAGLRHYVGKLRGHGSRIFDGVQLQQTWGDWGTRYHRESGFAVVTFEQLEAHLLPSSVYGEGAVIVEHRLGPVWGG